ncbi:SagB family peptide dehydrogenase [Kovacikia minuta CCNUW1]|uniref:SagB family peptide dehydrogenase n=1 Tax=Kovacikia minuta TaxID=2931930 RepID=UPI001CCF16FD|nr:SagB family peptide dehydrogenase [Kovacikia minuta]UBF24776.1 SagB family peptide dehydrogenase [Kovacikia minuta CCNUW1]
MFESTQSIVLSFIKNVTLIDLSAKQVILQSPVIDLTLKKLTPGLLTCLHLLASDGATEKELSQVVLQIDGTVALSRLYQWLQKFNQSCLLQRTVKVDSLSIATVVPISRYYQFQFKAVEPKQRFILSRFAYCRRQEDQIVLESPLAYAQVLVQDWRFAGLLHQLTQPLDCYELFERVAGFSESTIHLFVSLLQNLDLLTEETVEVREKQSDTLNIWSFHELLFHARSRVGRQISFFRQDNQSLINNHLLDVVKPQTADKGISLCKAKIEDLAMLDIPFTSVLEARKSIRTYDIQPITDRQLGEFLYRTARTKSITQTKEPRQISSRPYPSAGACYELELYITINRCQNLDSGFYHYCPKNHQIHKVSNRSKSIGFLLQGAAEAANQNPEDLQILIVIAARFPRWITEYASIMYSSTLKNVGVLYQTMYLVATAMNLAPCALSFGDSDLFAAATGTDYYSETSVGEFLLGSKQAD